MCLGFPYMPEGFPDSNSSNIVGTYMIFCGKQQGQALLLATKYHVCTCDITGVRAGKPLICKGYRSMEDDIIRLCFSNLKRSYLPNRSFLFKIIRMEANHCFLQVRIPLIRMRYSPALTPVILQVHT